MPRDARRSNRVRFAACRVVQGDPRDQGGSSRSPGSDPNRACLLGKAPRHLRFEVLIQPPPDLQERFRKRTMKSMGRHSLWLAAPVLVAACVVVAGCGVDNGLICGRTCDPNFGGDAGEGGYGAGDSAVGTQVDGASGEAATGDDTQADDSRTDGSDDGSTSMDSTAADATDASAAADAGCQTCGLATCCAPLLCASNNTSCCSGSGGPCGGDKGSCCSGGGLVCTTAQSCATSCNQTGSCMNDFDCCLGKSYCDLGNCTACHLTGAPCTAHDQCCGGRCVVSDGGTVCGSGG
jgi:hypothetical protein